MNKHIEILEEAIRNVEASAFYFEDTLGNLKVLNEDNYTSDLRCEWKMCLKKYGINDLLININLTKHFDSECFSALVKRFGTDEPERDFYHPDLVLHETHGNDNQQIIAVEIKRSPYASEKNVIKDIIKLIIYMTPGSFESRKKEFQFGAFIIVGYELSELKNLVTRTAIPEIEKYWDRIYCFSYKSTSMRPKDVKVEMRTLKELLNI